MMLDASHCYLDPTLEVIQRTFVLVSRFNYCNSYTDAVHQLNPQKFQIIQNVIETFYAVSTWGKQAKTEERKKRKALVGKTMI